MVQTNLIILLTRAGTIELAHERVWEQLNTIPDLQKATISAGNTRINEEQTRPLTQQELQALTLPHDVVNQELNSTVMTLLNAFKTDQNTEQIAGIGKQYLALYSHQKPEDSLVINLETKGRDLPTQVQVTTESWFQVWLYLVYVPKQIIL